MDWYSMLAQPRQHRGGRPQRLGQAEHRADRRRHGPGPPAPAWPTRPPTRCSCRSEAPSSLRPNLTRDARRRPVRPARAPPRLDYRGPTSDPSTLVQNEDSTWTRTYPDGTMMQFSSSGQETSEADNNGNTTSYAYVTSGAPLEGAPDDHRPGRPGHHLAYDSSGHLEHDHRPGRPRDHVHRRLTTTT